jgi:hypothetical protein
MNLEVVPYITEFVTKFGPDRASPMESRLGTYTEQAWKVNKRKKILVRKCPY